ncbi:MAG: GbsR/MarR family transcriptional regulator [Oligoflexus sp.]
MADLDHEKIAPELEDFADQIGGFMEYWGFKKVHGQIWVHLYLSNRNLDASDLMRRLSISKALVSISLKELLDFGVIEEAGKSPRGTRTYRATEDVSKPIIETIRRRERRLISRILSAYSLLARLENDDCRMMGIEKSKLEYLGHLITLVDAGLDHIVKRKWVAIAELLNIKRKILGPLANTGTRTNVERSAKL